MFYMVFVNTSKNLCYLCYLCDLIIVKGEG